MTGGSHPSGINKNRTKIVSLTFFKGDSEGEADRFNGTQFGFCFS